MTALETPGFMRDAGVALTDEERTEVISFLAANPEAVTRAERNAMKALLPRLVAGYRKRTTA